MIEMPPASSSAPTAQTSAPPTTQSRGRWPLLTITALGALALSPGCQKSPNGENPALPKPAEPGSRALELTPKQALEAVASGPASVADIAERVTPSVVSIHAEKVAGAAAQPSPDPFFNDPFFRHFFDRPLGQPRRERGEGLGSGVVISADGLVVTNNHLTEGAQAIDVTLPDGRNFPATIVGTDPKSDLAVLRVTGAPPLPPLKWGDSSKMRMGDVVLAIGNPYGVGQTVTMGIVSAVGRANVGIVDYEDFIQTDAAINPGNSGGALVNMRGELIGINTAILSRSGGNQGLGFAIPANLARPVIDSLIAKGKYVRGWLGVTIQDLDAELAAGLGLEISRGVLVSDIMAGTPAQQAGFQRGDVVVQLDGEEVASTAQFRNRVAQAGPGAKVSFKVLREGSTKILEARLAELPAAAAIDQPMAAAQGALAGATFGDLTGELRRRYGLPQSLDRGAVVTEVAPGSSAQRAGLHPGDVILELNRKPIASASELTAAYTRAKGVLLLLVQRRSATIYIAIKN